jgi:hypothetical protein
VDIILFEKSEIQRKRREVQRIYDEMATFNLLMEVDEPNASG